MLDGSQRTGVILVDRENSDNDSTLKKWETKGFTRKTKHQ